MQIFDAVFIRVRTLSQITNEKVRYKKAEKYTYLVYFLQKWYAFRWWGVGFWFPGVQQTFIRKVSLKKKSDKIKNSTGLKIEQN